MIQNAELQQDRLDIDAFCTAMKDKMAESAVKGRGGWRDCSPSDLQDMLFNHVVKGDPVDVANFCMMLWTMGQPTGKPLSE